MPSIINEDALNQLFYNGRTYSHWKNQAISADTLKKLFDLLKMCPTSANCSPARFIFVQSPEAKARLKPTLDAGNVEKTMSAPVTVIIAYDLEFYEKLPFLLPHVDARSWFAGNEEKIQETAFRNGSLQGAYLILAARSLGLDCGPMSGFNADKLNAEFFPDGRVKANFLCNLGYGDASSLHDRSPRFAFEEACEVL